jgi:hypothetical protein
VKIVIVSSVIEFGINYAVGVICNTNMHTPLQKVPSAYNRLHPNKLVPKTICTGTKIIEETNWIKEIIRQGRFRSPEQKMRSRSTA